MGTAEQRKQHWADRLAERIEQTGLAPVLSTGISPSGEIHIGNMREVLTADAVYRALLDRGARPGFNYVADNFDPLRRVYPFLDAARYAPLVGRPLSEIPAPEGALAASYADHFLEPFLASLRELEVPVEVVRADQLYKTGRMNRYIVQALEQRERIAAILHELTGKEAAADWSPFNPLCAVCARITHARVLGFSAAQETIDYACDCGGGGTLPMAGGGKLVWRIDWPARWVALGVTVEPFGKDHATRGGSYDTGVRIVREVFGAEPPFPIPYEWISLKGQGDMSSSKGNVLSVARMLEVVPPEVLRYAVLREQPQRTISFDPGLPLLQLVDELDDAGSLRRDERAVELSLAGRFEAVGVPFKHLIVVAQAVAFDAERVLEVLSRTGYPHASRAAVTGRLGYARRWLESFAPEDLRFTVQRELPPEARGLASGERQFLEQLGDRLRPEMDGQAVHDLVYELAGSFAPTPPAELFRAIYLALLGKPRGPRAGGFIVALGIDFCATRFREAARA